MRVEMSTYHFELREGDQITILEGSSQSSAEAESEAVQFLGELLRDRPGICDAPIRVTVVRDSQRVFTAEATFGPTGA